MMTVMLQSLIHYRVVMRWVAALAETSYLQMMPTLTGSQGRILERVVASDDLRLSEQKNSELL